MHAWKKLYIYIFSKFNFSKIHGLICAMNHQCQKVSGLIWGQTVCKVHLQTFVPLTGPGWSQITGQSGSLLSFNTSYKAWNHMGLIARKPVLGVSDKASFKPVSSATVTSLRIEISPVPSLHYDTFQKANNKGADQSAQMCRLVCACVVRKPPKTGFLALRPISDRVCTLNGLCYGCTYKGCLNPFFLNRAKKSCIECTA